MNEIKTHTRYKLGRASGSTPVWGDKWFENDVLETLPTTYINSQKYFNKVRFGDSNSPTTSATTNIHGTLIGNAALGDLNAAAGDKWEYAFGPTSTTVTTRRLVKVTISQSNTFIKEIVVPNVSRVTIPDEDAVAVSLGDVIYLLVEMVFELKRQNVSNIKVLTYNDSAPGSTGFLKRTIPVNRILQRVYNVNERPWDRDGVYLNSNLYWIGFYGQNISGFNEQNLPQPTNSHTTSIAAGTEWDGETPYVFGGITNAAMNTTYGISFIDRRLNIETIFDFGSTPVNLIQYGSVLRFLLDIPLNDTFIEPFQLPEPIKFVGYGGYAVSPVAERGVLSFSDFSKVRRHTWTGAEIILPGIFETNQYFSGEFAANGNVLFRTIPATSAFRWLREISSWGDLVYSGIELRSSDLDKIPNQLPASLTNMTRMFFLASIQHIANTINNWDVSNITNMESTFSALLDGANLDLSNWDVSNVTNMHRLFFQWPQTSTWLVEGIGNWDVSKVTDMSEMFDTNASFTSDSVRKIPIEGQGIDVIANWDTSSVTNMDRMFRNTRSDLVLNIRDWCVGNIITPPQGFAPAGTFLADIDNQPIWGFCPRTDIIVEMESGTFTVESSDPTLGQQIKLDGVWHNVSDLTFPISVTSKKNVAFRLGNSNSSTSFNITGSAVRRILSLAKQPLTNHVGTKLTFTDCVNLTTCLTDLPTWMTSTEAMFSGCFNLTTVNIKTTSHVTNMAGMFSGCINFTGNNLEHWNVSNVVYMNDMFNGVSGTNFDADISNWNVGNVLDMSSMFRDVINFSSSLSNWNVSKVTDFSFMFAGSNFNQNINTWNVGLATTLQGMFQDAILFNQPLNNWNVSNVLNMQALFQGAVLFNQPLNNWNTSKVTDMSFMFDGASDFNQNLHYLKTHKVTTMEAMFRNAISFNQDIALWAVYNITTLPNQFADNCPTNPDLYPMWGYNAGEDVIFKTKPTAVSINIRVYNGERYRFGLGEWVEVSGVVGGFATINFPVNTISSIYAGNNTRTNAVQWFQNVSGVDELISMSPFINYGAKMNFSASTGLTKVTGRFNYHQTSCDKMFDTCSQLVEVRFDLPSTVTNINRMFFNCANLEIIGSNWNTSGVTTTTFAFNGCSKFNHDISSWNVDNVTLAQSMFNGCSKFNRNINSWNLNNATNLANFFQNCTDFNQPLNDWDVSLVTNFTGMFRGCTSFNQNINNWNVSSATTMFQMFLGATVFNQPLNNWNVGNVTNMQTMFQNASAFNQNINNWNTSKVTTLFETFNGATSFNQPLNGWDVANVTSMSSMFFNAVAFNQPLNNWNTGKVTNMSGMFRNATAFNSDITTWDTGNVTNMGAMFQLATSFNQNINSWNLIKVTTMRLMFQGAINFNQPLNNWDVSNVTTMLGLFNRAASFNQPLNNWNTGKVTNMSGMFQDAILFNQPLNNWNVANVTNMSYMFRGCSSFNQPLNDWVLTSVITMIHMFNGASSFYQDLYAWRPHLIDRIATIPSFFLANSSMEQWLTPWSFGLVPTFRLLMKQELDVGSRQYRYDLDVYYEGGVVATEWVDATIIPANTQNKVTLKHYLTVATPEEFIIYTNRAEMGAPPTKLILNGNNILEVRAWETPLNVSPLTTVSFKNSPNLTVLPSTLKSSITSLESLAENCPLLTSNVTEWNTVNVTNFKNVFKGIPTFNQNISGWNMANATDISGMLQNCANFNQAIGGWDVSNVETMENFLAGATNFNQDLSNWNVSNVANMNGMFNGVNVYSHDLSLWCVTNIPTQPTNFASSGFPKSYYPQWGSCMFKNFNQSEDLVLEHSGVGNIEIYLFTGDKYTHNSVTTTAASNGVVSLNVGGIYIFEILPRAGMKIPIAGNGLKRVINWPYVTAISTGYTFLNASNLEFVPAYLPTYVENCVQMFEGCTNFNRDISIWDMAAITSMHSMFRNASNFNIAIGEWNVANVTNMDGLFDNAIAFDQDLSMWCVTNITEEPTNFNTNGLLDSAQKPVWGTCPTEET